MHTPCTPPAHCREVDHVVTTKELAAMIREAGIDFEALPGAWVQWAGGGQW